MASFQLACSHPTNPLLLPSSLKPRSPNSVPCVSFKPAPKLLTLVRRTVRVSTAAASFPPPPPATVEPEKPVSEVLTEEEKVQLLEEHLAANPQDSKSLRALMEAKVKSGKVAEAVSVADRLIALNPEDAELPLLKAHLLSYSGDTALAKQNFEELLQSNPFLVEAYHGLVMAASQSDDPSDELDKISARVEAAMEACKKEKRREDLRDFKLLIAQIKVIEGELDESLKIYGELVKEEPRDFRPYLCRGIIYTIMRKKDDAEKQFEKYRRLVPKGHPYSQFFDESMMAMKVLGQADENRRKSSGNV